MVLFRGGGYREHQSDQIREDGKQVFADSRLGALAFAY